MVSATLETSTKAPNHSMVWRQPTWSMPNCSSGGQIAPATAWPEAISATAEPRRRSNHRLT